MIIASHRRTFTKLYCGVDVDPANWNLGEKEIYARRSYFFNIFQADMVQVSTLAIDPALATYY